MLSEATLRQLSLNSGQTYDFDLSTINVSFYEPLFRTLQRFAINNIESIGFNCRELFRLEEKSNERYFSRDRSNIDLPDYIETSIGNKKTHYTRNIIELLSFIAPKSKILREIRLSYISMKREHLERLAMIIRRSPNIKSLVLYHMPIQNEIMRAMLNILNPETIQHISVIACGLTGACTREILSFIYKKSRPDIGIRTFELSPSEFCNADLRRIARALGGEYDSNIREEIPIHKSSRSNSPSNISASLRQKNYHTQSYNDPLEEINDDEYDDLPVTRPQDMNAENSNPLLVENEDDRARRNRIQFLQYENEQIEKKIKHLKEMEAAEKIGTSLYVVGPGSKKLVAYLKQLERKLIELDATPRDFP